MSGTRAISTTSRRELSPCSPTPLQGKAPKEIHTILKETFACFLPGRAKDLSAPLYYDWYCLRRKRHCREAGPPASYLRGRSSNSARVPLSCLKCTVVFHVTPGNVEGRISLLSTSFHINGMWIILRSNLCDMAYWKTRPVAHKINITYDWILVTWIITQSLGNRRKQWLIYVWTPGRNDYIHTSLLTIDK